MPTKIEWANETWNIVTGCEQVGPECRNCYAAKMAQRLKGRCGYPEDEPFQPGTFHEDKLTQPNRWKKPRMVFVSSMGDLFHDAVEFDIFVQVMETIIRNPRHTFLLLTKRPERMRAFWQRFLHEHWELPANVWFGVTVGWNHPTAMQRLDVLCSAAFNGWTRFVSVEPMIGSVDLTKHLDRLDWVICGAETGKGARPVSLDWIRSLRDQCVTANVPFFFKKFVDRNREIDGVLWEQIPEVIF